MINNDFLLFSVFKNGFYQPTHLQIISIVYNLPTIMSDNNVALAMDTKIINILLTSFRGLGLPNVLSIPIPASTSIAEFEAQLSYRLPQVRSRFILTTNSRRELSGFLSSPISSLLASSDDAFLPLRLSSELCGGKGGFGSQLRAAGGRMSSRRKKNQGDSNSSNRNLDGRRLRTVAEAKSLAEYLALKPEMEKNEKEARRKRWEQVVELAEKREAEARTETKVRVDVQWAMDKEEAEEKTRDAVLQALRSGTCHDNLTANLTGSFGLDSNKFCTENEDSRSKSKVEEPGFGRSVLNTRTYRGFDDDDNENDDDEGSSADGNEGILDEE